MAKRDNVRAVFFDAGYTLLCMDPPQETIFCDVCTELGIDLDHTRVAGAIERANVLFAPRTPAARKVPFSQKRVDEFWTGYQRIVLSGCARNAALAEPQAESVYRRFSQKLGWRIYDEVRPVLRALHERGILLGVISNWTGDLEDVLRRIGLHAQFALIVDSARFGHEKPHGEIFVEALRRANVGAAEAVHVGDSIDHDVEGALACGLRAVLLDRQDRHGGFSRSPRVRRLDEILALV